MTTLADCLSSEEIEKMNGLLASILLDKDVDDLTLREIKVVAAKLHDTKFSYASDTLKLIKAILA
jgi:hypothetical protein